MADLMTLEEVSAATGVPVATLRYIRATKPERGPRLFVLAGRVRAKRGDVEAWIEHQYRSTSTNAAS